MKTLDYQPSPLTMVTLAIRESLEMFQQNQCDGVRWEFNGIPMITSKYSTFENLYEGYMRKTEERYQNNP